MHVIKSVGVGRILINGDRLSQISIRTIGPSSTGIIIIAVGIVTIGITVVNIIAERKWRICISSGSIFPFCLSRQTITIRRLIPGYCCAGYSITRCKSFFFAFSITVLTASYQVIFVTGKSSPCISLGLTPMISWYSFCEISVFDI